MSLLSKIDPLFGEITGSFGVSPETILKLVTEFLIPVVQIELYTYLNKSSCNYKLVIRLLDN